MKKLLLLLALLLVPLSASAQVGNMFLRPFAGVPSGACAEPLGFALNTTNGDFYSCDAGAWVKIGPGAAATGYQTIEEEGTPLTQRTTLNMIGGTVTCVDNVTKTDCTFTAGGGTHDILSATHTDTTAAVVSRGSVVVGKLATPKWEELVLGGVNLYLKSNGTDLIYSTLAASGVGSCGANQFETANNADAVPTCVQPNFTNLSGSATDAQVPDTITLTNLTQVTTRNHSDTQGITAVDHHTAALLLSGGTMTGQAILAAAGAALSGGGLVDCDAATTAKLLWDLTTARFSCGTDQGGGASTWLALTDTPGTFTTLAFYVTNVGATALVVSALTEDADSINSSKGLEAPSFTGTGNPYIQLPNWTTPTVGDASTGRVVYESASQRLRASLNTAAFSDIALASDNLSLFSATTIAQLATLLSDENFTPGSEASAEGVLDLPDLQGQLVAGQYGAASIDSDDLVTANKTFKCNFVLFDPGGLADTDDIPSISNCTRPGRAITITEIWAETDAGTPSINLQRDDGTPANICTANLTPTTGGATCTVAAAEDNFAATDRLDFLMISASTAKRINIAVEYTVD